VTEAEATTALTTGTLRDGTSDRMRPPRAVPASRLVLAALATTMALAWPALLLNGAPLIFSDTMDFLAMGPGPERFIRPRGYAWLAGLPARASGSLWPVVALQALLTAALAHTALRVALPGLGARGHLVAGLGLAGLTTAPWAASYVMPDALAAPGLLGLFLLLALSEERRGTLALAAGVVALAAASHLTHFLTALAVLAALGLWRLVAGHAVPVRPRRLALAAAAALLGAAAALGANAALTGHAEYARGGGIFLGARLAGDGLLQRFLAEACPDPRLPRLCAARHRIPHDTDDFMWSSDSPLYDDGDFFALEPELAAAAAAALRAHWSAWVAGALGRTLRQFVALEAGDGLDRELALSHGPYLAEAVSPAAAAAAAASRQAREELAEHPLAAVPGPLALAALAACAILALGRGRRLARERPAAALLLAVVLLGAVANAGAVGFGGAVHARYQSRLAWLFPLAAGVALAALGPRAGRVPSGAPGRGRRAPAAQVRPVR
jgi:hypothetical protein